MIVRVRSGLIQEANRLAIQRHELPLEPNVSDLSDILLSATPIILKEECDGRGSVPVSPVQRELKDIRTGHGLGDFQGLCGG